MFPHGHYLHILFTVNFHICCQCDTQFSSLKVSFSSLFTSKVLVFFSFFLFFLFFNSRSQAWITSFPAVQSLSTSSRAPAYDDPMQICPLCTQVEANIIFNTDRTHSTDQCSWTACGFFKIYFQQYVRKGLIYNTLQKVRESKCCKAKITSKMIQFNLYTLQHSVNTN